MVERSRLRKNFAGLIQALTVGLPQYSATPTWMFFRNSLVSDLLFTGLFVLCMNFGRSSERSRRGNAHSARRPKSGMPGPEQRDEVEMLSLMLLIRRFEERASQQYQAQKIGGFCHLYIGQEAVVVGAVAATRPMITSSRLIAITPTPSPAEPVRTPAWRNFSEKRLAVPADSADRCITSIKETPHVRRSRDRRRPRARWRRDGVRVQSIASEDRVTLCFFGDGAINQGAFHEALNLAGLYKLPIIFICENNLFAMGTSVERSTSLKQIVDRAEGYDMPGDVVDGMNFREVRDKLAEIVDFDPQRSASRFHRNPNLSLSRPLHVGSGKLSDERGAGKIPLGRSDHAVARAAHSRRQADERGIRQDG